MTTMCRLCPGYKMYVTAPHRVLSPTAEFLKRQEENEVRMLLGQLDTLVNSDAPGVAVGYHAEVAYIPRLSK